MAKSGAKSSGSSECGYAKGGYAKGGVTSKQMKAMGRGLAKVANQKSGAKVKKGGI